MSLTQNQWGFSVRHDNPFEIFSILQEAARASIGEENMIDLSRGDPGYGFTPSISGREFFGYLIMLDAHLNSWDGRYRPSETDLTWKKIEAWTRENFPKRHDFFMKSWNEIFSAFFAAQTSCSRTTVLTTFFQNCAASGGAYLDPAGQPLFRALVAAWHQRHIQIKIDSDDIIFVQGASHAIGTLFKLFGEEGLSYLKKGDTVMIASPAYSPYNLILENRGFRVFPLSLDPITGLPSRRCLKRMRDFSFHDEQNVRNEQSPESSQRVKLIVFIDPNNPTGICAREDFLRELAYFAEKNDSIVITDEVYSDFFPSQKSLIDFCPKRVLRIHARSKIERSTGLRFGDLLVNREAQRFLRECFGVDFVRAFINAKGPGGVHGELFHTTFVSGPAQALGVLHMILGTKDREHALSMMRDSRERFFRMLDEAVSDGGRDAQAEDTMSPRENMYYAMFDLNLIARGNMRNIPIEEKLLGLAKRGVVYIPAYRFFHEEDRMEKDLSNFVRASFVNATPDRVEMAAKITKEYLTGSAV